MGAKAGELLEIMTFRLKMQVEGITNPPESVKAATRMLVERLAQLDPSESIEVAVGGVSIARYIQAATGDVLAEIREENT